MDLQVSLRSSCDRMFANNPQAHSRATRGSDRSTWGWLIQPRLSRVVKPSCSFRLSSKTRF